MFSNSNRSLMKPKIGDERWLVEKIDADKVERMAKKAGWSGGNEGLREFFEPENAAVYESFSSLEAAIAAANKWLATGRDFYGCVIIDHQVLEEWEDYINWERHESYEVARDGQAIRVDR
jgi:hypothetical protein